MVLLYRLWERVSTVHLFLAVFLHYLALGMVTSQWARETTDFPCFSHYASILGTHCVHGVIRIPASHQFWFWEQHVFLSCPWTESIFLFLPTEIHFYQWPKRGSICCLFPRTVKLSAHRVGSRMTLTFPVFPMVGIHVPSAFPKQPSSSVPFPFFFLQVSLWSWRASCKWLTVPSYQQPPNKLHFLLVAHNQPLSIFSHCGWSLSDVFQPQWRKCWLAVSLHRGLFFLQFRVRWVTSNGFKKVVNVQVF